MHVDHKVAGGKLLRVDFEIDASGVISFIRIAGDFFVHPEEGILEIEHGLAGVHVSDVASRFDSIVDSFGLKVVGFDGDDLVAALNHIFHRSHHTCL